MKYKEAIYPSILADIATLKMSIDQALLQREDEALTNLFITLDDLEDQTSNVFSGTLGSPCLRNILVFVSDPENGRLLMSIFPLGFRKFTVLLDISTILEEDENLDLDSEIDFPVESFKLVADEGPKVPFSAFGFFNPTRKIDSIGYFDFQGDWLNEMQRSNFNHALLACSIITIDGNRGFTFDKPYVLVRNDATNIASIHATLRLQAVAHGIPVHSAVTSNIRPSLAATSNISAIQPYQQFNETILILSEFNSRGEVLNKFLSLYHVMESFMYKIPIAELGANNNGKMFSIRDFRRLYGSVDKSEINAIKDICKGFWSEKIGNISFGAIVNNALKNLPRLPGFDKAEFNLLLNKLTVAEANGFDQLLGSHAVTCYASLIYKIRCAIVHNSETEFHISHFNLSKTLTYILDELLMKPLEMLIFSQIADHKSRVWYKGPSLHLYEV